MPMSTQVIMPQFGESVVEGTVARWLIRESQPVRQDEPLLQVTTDKVDTEIPAPASGMLLKIYVPEGQTVPKGTALAEIGEVLGIGVSGTTDQQLPDTQYPMPDIGFISPAVARLAGELNVDLSQVIGTGEGGRITKKDVLAYVAAPVPREPPGGFAADRPQGIGRRAAGLGTARARDLSSSRRMKRESRPRLPRRPPVPRHRTILRSSRSRPSAAASPGTWC